MNWLVILLCANTWPAFGSEVHSKAAHYPRARELAGLGHVFQLTERIFSGSSPSGPGAFATLQGLGISTVISVDGSKPDVDSAHRHGIRYIHIPIGYDGISGGAANQLIKAAAVSKGGVYLHCHHGRHRGPAAAALISMCEENWSVHQALDWLELAGTSVDYPGLFKAVENFTPPSMEDFQLIPDEFPETAKVAGLVDAMVKLDSHWDHLKMFRNVGFKPLSSHPDLVPEHEALMMIEVVQEWIRSGETGRYDSEFVGLFSRMKEDVIRLKEILGRKRTGEDGHDPDPVGDLWKAVDRACATCHQRYRN